jgi:hypothetical protein
MTDPSPLENTKPPVVPGFAPITSQADFDALIASRLEQKERAVRVSLEADLRATVAKELADELAEKIEAERLTAAGEWQKIADAEKVKASKLAEDAKVAKAELDAWMLDAKTEIEDLKKKINQDLMPLFPVEAAVREQIKWLRTALSIQPDASSNGNPGLGPRGQKPTTGKPDLESVVRELQRNGPIRPF